MTFSAWKLASTWVGRSDKHVSRCDRAITSCMYITAIRPDVVDDYARAISSDWWLSRWLAGRSGRDRSISITMDANWTTHPSYLARKAHIHIHATGWTPWCRRDKLSRSPTLYVCTLWTTTGHHFCFFSSNNSVKNLPIFLWDSNPPRNICKKIRRCNVFHFTSIMSTHYLVKWCFVRIQ